MVEVGAEFVDPCDLIKTPTFPVLKIFLFSDSSKVVDQVVDKTTTCIVLHG